MKRKLIVIAGPTAVGKTSLSVKLAKRIGGEIISADSMQIYKEMDIGSAKIKENEKEGIEHYLIDLLDPSEEFNVYKFKELAKSALEKIYAKGKIPIIAGGTGFYIQALLYDIDFEEEDNSKIRNLLEKEAAEGHNEEMFERLLLDDPEYAATIHKNNTKKIIRALEYITLNGRKFSEHIKEEKQKESPYDFKYFVLNDRRERLFDNIEKRVDNMLEEGLVDEVRHLHDKGYNRNMVSMQGLGYKEMLDYLNQNISYDEAVLKIKTLTRHFAKRQLTWFKREKDTVWINKYDFDYDDEQILDYMIGVINGDKQ